MRERVRKVGSEGWKVREREREEDEMIRMCCSPLRSQWMFWWTWIIMLSKRSAWMRMVHDTKF